MTAARRSENRQRTRLVAVRFLPSEHTAVTDAARCRGVSLSEFIRHHALSAALCPRCKQSHKEPHCADGREYGPLTPVEKTP